MENTLQNPPPITASHDWPALAGPAVIGAALGFSSGALAMAKNALLLPALVAGLAVSMTPALYIGLSLAGAKPTAAEVARAAVGALRAAGLVMAGTAPATLFLVASTRSLELLTLLAVTAVGGASLLGMRTLARFLRNGAGMRPRAYLVYIAWALVALALGADLFHSALTLRSAT